MIDTLKIQAFSKEWIAKFEDPNSTDYDLADHYLGDDCHVLGFKMDCGEAFSEKYGKAVHDSEALSEIIHEVNDISLLGSAIYSRWRYYNHWAYSGEEILEEKNRRWFVLALERLAKLAQNK